MKMYKCKKESSDLKITTLTSNAKLTQNPNWIELLGFKIQINREVGKRKRFRLSMKKSYAEK